MTKIATITTSEFAQHQLTEPAIVKGGLAEWPMASFSPKALAERFGAKDARVHYAKDGRFDYRDDMSPVHEMLTVPFHDLPALVESPAPARYYLQQTSVFHEFPELASELRIPTWVEISDPTIALWVGSAGTVSPLHFDHYSNLFCQMYGRKRFTLFAPTETAHLYRRPLFSPRSHASYVDLEAPDFEKFPELKNAQSIECEVGVGDILYLPPFYWHHVRSLEVSVSLSCWWDVRPEQYLVPNGITEVQRAFHKDRFQEMGERIRSSGGTLSVLAEAALAHGFIPASVLLSVAAVENAGGTADSRIVDEAMSGIASQEAEVRKLLERARAADLAQAAIPSS